ncbi:helix-turn-helix domain-containing protein [Paenibacillaceae bacterium WGS1546]|uniref:AraC family transcriptional regulator n=1 Tax=Cohnella sp. WGS1546 TaxID=3366810 RepID=UPI00372D696E
MTQSVTPEHEEYFVRINPSPSNGEIAVLFSGEAQPSRLHKMGPAIHDYYLFHTVLSGFGDFSIGGKSYRCGAGDTFAIFPGELFAYQADGLEPWRYAWFAFVGPGAAAAAAAVGVSPEEPVIRGSLNPKTRHYYDQLHRCFESPDAELANLEAEGWIRLMLGQLGVDRAGRGGGATEASADADQVVKRALQFLALHYAQPISISRMASMLGYHRTHLCKLFKQATGASPMQYLLQIRMQRAEMLLASPMSVEQVASSVGYADALYFSKKFRAWSGRSPSEYRKALRSLPERPATND